MPATYGDIKDTVGADGDPIDVYVGEKPTSDRVWVIDQIDPTTKEFDEHKTFVGFETPEQVLAAYDGSFSDGIGPSRRGRVNEMSHKEFETWLKGDTTKAIHYEKPSEPKPEVTAEVPKVPAAVATPAQPAAAASTHEEKLAHKRKIDEEHGKSKSLEFRKAATTSTPTYISPADAALNAKIKQAAEKTNPSPTPDDAAEGTYDKGEVDIGGIRVVIEHIS